MGSPRFSNLYTATGTVVNITVLWVFYSNPNIGPAVYLTLHSGERVISHLGNFSPQL